MSLAPPFKYQEYVHQKIVKRKRTAIIGAPGSGKTRPAITSVDELGGFESAVLVVCSGPAIATWTRQIPLWRDKPDYADNIHVVQDEAFRREKLWRQAHDTKFGTYICNFSTFYRDWEMIKKIPWRVVMCDEYHKVMRSHKIHVKTKKGVRLKTYGKFLQMTRHTEILILLTGSLIRGNASSMFTAFQLVKPKLFSSYWRFVRTFCYVDDTGFGADVHGVRNAGALRKIMDEHFAYIPLEVVADQLPEGARIGIDVGITAEQRRIYKELDEDMMTIIGESVVLTPTVLSKITRLRQLLCCPKILNESLGMGASFEAIVDRLDQDPHVAIFVPFRPAVDYFVDELRRLGYEATGLYGGIGNKEQQSIVDSFRARKSIIVCTIQYAESFDLETCKTSYFCGYDLTADQNEQAEGRTRRAISAHEFVTWNYLKTNTPLDMYFLDKLGDDQHNAHLVLQRPEEFIQALLQETR